MEVEREACPHLSMNVYTTFYRVPSAVDSIASRWIVRELPPSVSLLATHSHYRFCRDGCSILSIIPQLSHQCNANLLYPNYLYRDYMEHTRLVNYPDIVKVLGKAF